MAASDAYGFRQSQKLPCAFWLKTRTKRIDQIDAPKQQGRCIVQAQTGLGGFTDKSYVEAAASQLEYVGRRVAAICDLSKGYSGRHR